MYSKIPDRLVTLQGEIFSTGRIFSWISVDTMIGGRYDYAILESHRIVLETCFSQAVKSYFIFKENLNKKYSVVTKIYFIEFWGGWTRAPI